MSLRQVREDIHHEGVSSSQSPIIVPLHQLCEKCETFCKEWKFLDYLTHPGGDSNQTWPYASFLCSGEHLINTQSSCHLCKMILRWALPLRLRKQKPAPSSGNVYLGADIHKESQFLNVFFQKTLPTEGDSEGCFASFRLKTYDDSEQNGFDGYFAAKEVPLDSQENVGRAKGWIETCLAEHPECREFQKNTVGCCDLPTRVLEITGEKSVKLRCNMSNNKLDYIALSHMWGPDHGSQIRLVQSRVKEFEENIPWKELPKIYTEAIQATRKLGYCYLWIDSLCIIQDSERDWAYEAQRMAIVYGNAMCNLTFLFPPFSTKPKRDDPRIWSPCILRPASSSSLGVYMCFAEDDMRIKRDDRRRDWLSQDEWPLFSRAWTFQEYLMAPRILLCGHKNLMWQCSRMFYDELLGQLAVASAAKHGQMKGDLDWCKSRYFPSSLKSIMRGTENLTDPKMLNFMLDWTSLIQEYRSRDLSFEKDRVVAFSAIARAYSKLGSLTYLAGCWAECIALSLLWVAEPKPSPVMMPFTAEPISSLNFTRSKDPDRKLPPRDGAVKWPEAIDAPTWSWFSLPGYRSFQVGFLLKLNQLGFLKWEFLDDIFVAKLIAFQFHDNPPNYYPEDGFSNFNQLRITLQMLTWPVRDDLPFDLATQFHNLSTANDLDANLGWEPTIHYYPDMIDSRNKVPPRNGIFALVFERQLVRTLGADLQRRLAGLVLVPGSGPGTWRRVGLWQLNIRISDVEVNSDNISAVVQRWKTYQVTSPRWKREEITLV